MFASQEREELVTLSKTQAFDSVEVLISGPFGGRVKEHTQLLLRFGVVVVEAGVKNVVKIPDKAELMALRDDGLVRAKHDSTSLNMRE